VQISAFLASAVCGCCLSCVSLSCSLYYGLNRNGSRKALQWIVHEIELVCIGTFLYLPLLPEFLIGISIIKV
jgi:hypothetical protein